MANLKSLGLDYIPDNLDNAPCPAKANAKRMASLKSLGLRVGYIPPDLDNAPCPTKGSRPFTNQRYPVVGSWSKSGR
ncbi:hypothetical protein P5673_004327 [Acropora cervicornis]|uniref:Uncharacterized protein n=1 Tax=Acropora cervicornis TaxID=6130 RepID=A0AAD9R008_ACRCE|nr:hypothetical protein P5673_004327 [Acropora cervicornis]